MYCRNCGQYVDEDMMFCPRCGFQVNQPKRICYYCKNPLRENEIICPCCGRNQQAQSIKDDDPYKGYWKKPILWIILIALFLSATFISEYISSHPVRIDEAMTSQGTVKLTGNMDVINICANNQCEGYAMKDKDHLYCVKDKNLYIASIDQPNKTEKLIDNCQGYLSIENEKLYYCDIYYDYYSYDLKTKEKVKILENIYYPVVVNNQLYYQLDEDNESIHCFNLNTKEDKKYNDGTSYDISIDKENEKIYYLSYVDEKYALKRMNFNGEADEKIYDCQENISFVLDDKSIFINDNGKIVKINKSNKKETVLKENVNVGYINICDDKLVFNSGTSLYTMSKDGQDEEKIYSGYVTEFQIVGKNIVIKSYNENYDKTISVLDLKGHIMALFEQSEIEEIEGLEEV